MKAIVDDVFLSGTCTGIHQIQLAKLLKTGIASPEDLEAMSSLFISLAEQRIHLEVNTQSDRRIGFTNQI